MKKLKVYALISLAIISMKISAMDPNNPDMYKMEDVLKNYYEGVPRTPEDTLKYSEKQNFADKEAVQAFLEKSAWIEKLSKKSNSYNNILPDYEAAIQSIKDNNPESQNLKIHVPNAEYYVLLPIDLKCILIMSSQYLRMLNLKEKNKCYSARTLSSEQVATLDKEVPTVDTYQHISMVHYDTLARRAIFYKNLDKIFVPFTLLIKLPWAKGDNVADDTYGVIQEYLGNDMRPVDQEFIDSMTYEEVRQMYEFIKCVGVWDDNLASKWYVTTDRKMCILGIRQPDKNSPEYYASHIDPLLGRRLGIKNLAQCFKNDKQRLYLSCAINTDPELHYTDDYSTKHQKNFAKTVRKLIVKAAQG